LLGSSHGFNPAPPGPKRVDSTDDLLIVAGDKVIIDNSGGLWIGQMSANSVKVIAHVAPAAGKLRRTLGEPVLVEGCLFIRQLDADPKSGLLPILGNGGNLICLDLQATK